MRLEHQEEPYPDSQLRGVRCAGPRDSKVCALTELCGLKLKVV
jgi:hypothetical protein